MSRGDALRELDALVAEKVFGERVVWGEVLDKHGEHMEPFYEDDGTIFWSGPDEVFRYSSSILEAWYVVEKMQAENRIVRLTFNPHLKWHCEIFPPWSERVVSFPHGGKVHRTSFYVMAETAPLAICRAAIAAMDAQQNAPTPSDSISS